jgi:hypothetical protein
VAETVGGKLGVWDDLDQVIGKALIHHQRPFIIDKLD